MGKGFFYCIRCQQKFAVSADTTDFVHTCNAISSTINKEDMRNTSNSWSDYTGTGTRIAPLNVLGITNKIAGTRAHLQFGARLPKFTSKGNDAQLYRERQFLQYQELKEDEK